MKLEKFIAGTYRQNYQHKSFSYKSFSPAPINTEWSWEDPVIHVLLEKASRALASLDAYSFMVPNIDLFIKMHIAKEANTSSRIEGTKTNINEDLLPKEDLGPEKRDDWQEVKNYVNAMNTAITELEHLPLSNRLLRNTHVVLMQGVRGANKYPGEFRISQNWIGGSNLTDASYIPPNPDEVPELMGDLEKFLHNLDIQVPHLIRIAIAHYQFETIHPFCDGNGRIGRLMIPLYLIDNKLLGKPSLYLSYFFERNRQSYYDALDMPRRSGDLCQWIKFFLNGIIQTSENGIQTFNGILQLKQKMDQLVVTFNRKAQNAQKLVHFLYKSPIIAYDDACRELELTARPVNELIQMFVDHGILQKVAGNYRNKKFSFTEYINLFLTK